MNEKLINYACHLMKKHAEHYEHEAQAAAQKGKSSLAEICLTRALAYDSAHCMLFCAINGNYDCLKEYDYYD